MKHIKEFILKKMRINCKGMTIVEAAIAMTLLVIIIVIALTMSSNAISATASTIKEFNAANRTVDLIEIFQESEDKEDFLELVTNIYNLKDSDISKEMNGSYDITIDKIIYNCHLIQNTIIINAYRNQYKDTKLHYYSYNKG